MKSKERLKKLKKRKVNKAKPPPRKWENVRNNMGKLWTRKEKRDKGEKWKRMRK